jgi:hypothetical protein
LPRHQGVRQADSSILPRAFRVGNHGPPVPRRPAARGKSEIHSKEAAIAVRFNYHRCCAGPRVEHRVHDALEKVLHEENQALSGNGPHVAFRSEKERPFAQCSAALLWCCTRVAVVRRSFSIRTRADQDAAGDRRSVPDGCPAVRGRRAGQSQRGVYPPLDRSRHSGRAIFTLVACRRSS